MTSDEKAFARGICLLRLSAIGDVAHTISVIRTLQAAVPQVPLTWVVGRTEAAVAALVPGIEVVPVDKRRPLAELRRLRRQWQGRRFDALLHMQVAFRASLLTLAVRAPLRVGFDRVRGNELQGWFVNRRIEPAPPPGEHVLDGLRRFPAALGLPVGPPRWELTLPSADQAWAERLLPPGPPVVAINLCASIAMRDWPPARCVPVVAHARRRGWRVVVCGGPTERERRAADVIQRPEDPGVVDLVGRTSLAQLLAVLARSAVLVSPDSGPVHLATAVGTPVVALFAVSNLQRAAPYVDRRWCVDRRDEAARRFRGKPASELGWRETIDHPGAMALIEADAVIEQLEAAIAATPGGEFSRVSRENS